MTSDMRCLKSMIPVAFLVGAMLGTAWAQEPGSRAEEQAQQQEEKARALTAYRPPWIVRRLLAIEEAGGFGAVRGLVVTFGDIKRGSGPALGPAYGRTLASGTDGASCHRARPRKSRRPCATRGDCADICASL